MKTHIVTKMETNNQPDIMTLLDLNHEKEDIRIETKGQLSDIQIEEITNIKNGLHTLMDNGWPDKSQSYKSNLYKTFIVLRCNTNEKTEDIIDKIQKHYVLKAKEYLDVGFEVHNCPSNEKYFTTDFWIGSCHMGFGISCNDLIALVRLLIKLTDLVTIHYSPVTNMGVSTLWLKTE